MQDPWHLSVAFDVAINHLKKGDQVTFLDFSKSVEHHSHNRYANKTIKYISDIFNISTKLAKEITKQYPYTFKFELVRKLELSDRNFHVAANLIAEAVEKDNIAQFGLLREPNLKIKITSALKSQEFKLVYSNVMQRVTNQDFDLIYTYNSRFLNEKAVEEVAKYLQKKVNFLDRFVLNWPDF
jgi:hypothetical protein